MTHYTAIYNIKVYAISLKIYYRYTPIYIYITYTDILMCIKRITYPIISESLIMTHYT